MSRRLAALVTLVATPVAAAAPQDVGPVQLAWSVQHDAQMHGNQAPVDVARAGDVAFVACTVNGLANTLTDIATYAVHVPSGQTLWQRSFDSTLGGRDEAAAICASSAAALVLVAGSAGGLTSPSFVATGIVLAYDAATGQLAWSAPCDHANTRWAAISTSPDGARAFVTGTDASFNPPRMLAAAYDVATGVRLWQITSVPAGNEAGHSIAVTPDASRVLIGGNQFLPISHTSRAWALAAADGAILWNTTVNSPVNSVTGGHAITVSPSGEFAYLAGNHASAAVVSLRVADGTQAWKAAVTNFRALDLALSPDGARIVAAGPAGTSGQFPFHTLRTVALDAAGAIQWERALGVTSAAEVDAAQVALSPDGSRVFVTGAQRPLAKPSVWLGASYGAPSGAQQWTLAYGQPYGFGEAGVGLVSGPTAGDLLLVGRTSKAATANDSTLLSIDPHGGALLGSNSFDLVGSAQEFTTGAFLSADGARVYAHASATSAAPELSWFDAEFGAAELTAFDSSTGQPLWTALGGADGTHRIESTTFEPTTACADAVGLRAFIGGRVRILAVYRAFVEAFDASDGHLLWKAAELGQPFELVTHALVAAPDATRVYAVGQGSDLAWWMRARAFDAATGAQLWLSSLPSADGPMYAAASPDGTRVYCAGTVDASSDWNGFVAALDAATGSVAWLRHVDSLGGSQSGNTDHLRGLALDAAGARIYAVTHTPFGWMLTCFDASSGSPQWNARCDPGVVSPFPNALALSADGQRAYVGGSGWSLPGVGGHIQAIETADGATAWNVPVPEFVSSIAVEPDGSRLTCTGSTLVGGQLIAFARDAGSGALLWKRAFPAAGGGEASGRVALVAPAGGRAWVVGHAQAPSSSRDVLVEAYDLPLLTSSVGSASLSNGSSVDFDLCGGAAQAGDLHVLIGSTSGTAPGFDVDGVHVPLVLDGYLLGLLASPNSLIVGAVGLLDPHGYAAASMTVPAGADPALAGLVVNHAWVGLDLALGQVVVASNPFALALLP
ncbi:MAG: hypothetical protein EPO68_00715 [Planctomycetota bacterium]|nr:MAG: hypothetical protein EPO68_00715 [Planctomycetota bacterium]